MWNQVVLPEDLRNSSDCVGLTLLAFVVVQNKHSSLGVDSDTAFGLLALECFRQERDQEAFVGFTLSVVEHRNGYLLLCLAWLES